MTKAPQIESASIVAIGSFNPAIFQPVWLGKQELIRTEEAENAKIVTIQPEVADFSTEWFQLQVLQERFQVTCQDSRQYAPLRDLAAAIFELLPHTPVKRIGFNRDFHFQMPSVESWHGIGDLLAPKDTWKPILDVPGLRSMRMEGRRKQENGGVVHITVEPSKLVNLGLYIQVNEEFRSPDGAEGASWVTDRLAEHWDGILSYAESTADHFLGLVK